MMPRGERHGQRLRKEGAGVCVLAVVVLLPSGSMQEVAKHLISFAPEALQLQFWQRGV